MVAPESEVIERKASASDRSGIRRSICAFANDLAETGRPGVLLLGVTDTGRCAEMEITDRLIQQVAAMRDDGNILPTPSMQVFEREAESCRFLVIEVRPSAEPPVRYQGRVWVRVGNTTRQATPEEEQRLFERRRAYQLPFDHRPVQGAATDDLDLDFFRRTYLPAAVAPDVLDLNQRSVEHQLSSLRLLTDNVPNYGAILILGRDISRWIPGAYVQFLRIDGTRLDDPITDAKELSGPLYNVVRLLDELLDINISVGIDITSGSKERRIPSYPVVALQQYVRNALIHRAYEGTNAQSGFTGSTIASRSRTPAACMVKFDPTTLAKG
jgi:ATP-dependent DNA helicase RecG